MNSIFKSDIVYHEHLRQTNQTIFGDLKWTDKEKQRMFNSYPYQNKETLLKLFPDRTWPALKGRAHLLRIPRSKRKYSVEEDNLILKLREEGLSYPKMVKFFEKRTAEGLRRRHHRLMGDL